MRRTKKRKHAELSALKGRIREKGTSYREISDEIGITASTLCNKINGFYPMTAEEMAQIATILDINPKEIAKFFMPGYCETHQQVS